MMLKKKRCLSIEISSDDSDIEDSDEENSNEEEN